MTTSTNPLTGQTLNAWTDKAREASLRVRRAASKTAYELSVKAHDIGEKAGFHKEHEAAVKAHQQAYKAHKDAASVTKGKTKKEHEDTAEHHKRVAISHGQAYLSGKKDSKILGIIPKKQSSQTEMIVPQDETISGMMKGLKKRKMRGSAPAWTKKYIKRSQE